MGCAVISASKTWRSRVSAVCRGKVHPCGGSIWNLSLYELLGTAAPISSRPAIDVGACWLGDSTGWWFRKRRSAGYSYRYFSESASACSMSAIVSSGIRSWASVTSAEVGWASAGSHWSGFQAPLRRSDLGQCG